MGQSTWGQFFVYQGFNDRVGWMHTSSNADAVDEYREKVIRVGDKLSYLYGGASRAFTTKPITLNYKTPEGISSRTLTAMYTLHGPVIRRDGDNFITIQLMNIPVAALEQSYLRTKARNYAEYKKTMELQANSSNNTIFVDGDGDIAYWHGNFIPNRDTRFDYTKPVDGSNPATNWQGLMTVDQVPHLLNPKSGYLFNVNDSPWNSAGAYSLRKEDYPVYVEQGIETARGLHAMCVLAPGGTPRRDFSLDQLMDAAYGSYLPWFAKTVPVLVAAYDALPPGAPLKTRLNGPILLLRGWDYHWGTDSIATSLAVYWRTELMKKVGLPAHDALVPSEEWVATRLSVDALLTALATASDKLSADFGTFERLGGRSIGFSGLREISCSPSTTPDRASRCLLPHLFGGLWPPSGHGSFRRQRDGMGQAATALLPSWNIGDKVRARAVTADGESGHPDSKHFNDEAGRYTAGNLREVYFYPEQLNGHTERMYHPGE